MINKISLLLMLCFVITSCTMDCVEPGLQSRNTSVNVDVPVRETNNGSKIHWVDSNQVIGKDEQIKFSIGGSVNFCHSKKDKNPKKVLVPASFCSNGDVPNYDKAKDITKVPDNYGVKALDNYGVNEKELCVDKGIDKGFGSSRRYIDTEIKVNPGDKLSFSLVPRKIKIDCNNLDLFKGKVVLDGDYKNISGSNATIQDICKGGQFINKKGEVVDLNPLDKRKDSKGNEHYQAYEVFVGNGYTPYDNKVHDIQAKVPWINGALLDLRRVKTGLNDLCSQDQGHEWEKRCDSNEGKKYSSYELNCYVQNICYNDQGVWNGGSNKNCASSIRYEKYDNRQGACDMYSHLNKVKKELTDDKDSTLDQNASWAEALVAKIAPSMNYDNTPENDRLDIRNDAEGTQCLPQGTGANGDSVCSKIDNDFEHFSLRLNYDYTVNTNIEPGSSVMLGIADHGASGFKRGGYHVEVTRSCEFTEGNKLYFYLGDNPPMDLPGIGTNDFNSVLGLHKRKEDNVYYYKIDGGSFLEGETKKIYFGIDVSNVKVEDITYEKDKYYEDNKYTVNLFVKKKINNFISSTVNDIFKFIMEGGNETIKDSYEGYRKGLLQGVRALLTLYVIFTVVGYMLGTVQLSKFDFIVRITKIAFIAFAFSEQSWELFGTNLSKLFVGGSVYLVDSFSGYIGEGGKKFAFLDLTAGVLFTSETWLKFLSLMLSGPFGFIAFLLILKATFMFLKCMISAIVKYVIATVLGAFLLSLTPLFIVFMLFQQTKSLFDNWIKTLAQVSFQPVILFSSLAILNQLMYSVLYNLTNFSACYQCLISVNFMSYDLCLMKSILPLGYSAGTSVDVALNSGRSSGYFAALPIDLVQAFIYLIIAGAMEAFVSMSDAMAQAIFGVSFGVAGNIGRVAHSASQSVLSTVGLDDNTQNMIQRIKGGPPKDKAGVDFKGKPPSNDQTPGQSGGPESAGDKTKEGKTKPPSNDGTPGKSSGQESSTEKVTRKGSEGEESK
ncbi:TrbL/VirB6 family protein [Wolbachia endosymbiont of Folsomia candida]|uniref:type IV secretion system protein n=1 Tax=Wolbachia endosymbiont of Folsomia candida TaxID=169402 RepID=UPI000DBF1E44|nr:type IV secretion system protein [Wolbachia endosymbiont of Folsomia candida]APR98355.2 conjugal transfer protein TrbL [Wolbachia endosymbiont of Folsomia candida]